jgi:hypothetical protein
MATTMKPRKLLLALLVGAGCVALAGIPAGASGQTRHSRGHAKIRISSIQVGSKAGPLVLRVRGKGEAKLKLAVDGHRVPAAFEFDGRHTQVAELRADILRPGANKLLITGPGRARATRTVEIPGRLLLVDAGADVGTTVKAKTKLGTAPAVAGRGSDTTYDWSVVSRPKGAKVMLRDADGARPLLDPATPGTYVLQVEANPEGTAPPTFDQIVVSASLSAPPLGVPINTSDAGRGGAIVIGAEAVGSSPDGLAYAVLERKTGATVASGSVGGDASGIARLQDLSDQYAGGDRFRFLMIVSGRPNLLQYSALASFDKFAGSVGAAPLAPEDFTFLARGSGFTVMGVPGASEGAATVRIPGTVDPPASGAITGYLEQNQAVDVRGSKLWEYVSPDHPSFDTRAPGSNSTHNVMKVEGRDPITADLPPGVTAGLHVVVLESLTLRTLDNVILGTNGTTAGGITDRQRQSAAATKLREVINDTGGPLVMLQTVGKPKAAGPEWEGIVDALSRVGANRQLVNALDGTTEYALVARVESAAPPAESSTAYDHGPYRPPHLEPARLVGSLSRGRADAFEPTVSSTPTGENPEGTVNLGLMKTAYQPAEAWPAFPGDAAKAKLAEEYICGKLGFCGPAANHCPTVRQCFWQEYDEDWAHVEDIIGRMAFPTGQTGFDEATFQGVRGMLEEEAGEVSIVERYLAALRAPLERSSTRSYVDLQAIGKQVYDSVQRPAGDNSRAYVLGLIGKVAALGGFAGPPVSAAAAGLSASFGLASYLSTESGQPILGTEINVKAESVAQEIFDRVDAANRTSRGIGLLLVSDYGKLTSAARNIRGDWKLAGDQTAIENQLRTGSKQWFYEALVPAGYPYLIRGNALNAKALNCFLYSSRRAWPNQPDVDQMQATVGYDANGNPIRAIFFFTTGIGGGSSPTDPIGDSMFKPLDEGGLGIEKLRFFTPQVWGGRIFHAVSGNEKCDVGFLPDRG